MADRVKVGNTEIAMVWDAEFRYAPAMFIPSMPPEKWAPFLNGLTVDDIQESRVMTFLIRSGGKKWSDQIKGIITRDLFFDVTADAVGMIVPGGSIAVKLVKAVVDRKK